MKITSFLPTVFFTFCGLFLPGICAAQSGDIPDPTLIKPPHVILQAGVSTQWLGGEPWRSSVVSLELPVGLYQHVGLEVNFLFPDFTEIQSSTYFEYGQRLEKHSYEVGLFYKIFLHGRLTGRRSNLYVAPEFKFGRRNFVQFYDGSTFPLPIDPTEVHFWERTSKFALRLGAQFHIGRGILEVALPIAIEKFKTVNARYNYELYNYNNPNAHLLLLPTLQFGIAF